MNSEDCSYIGWFMCQVLKIIHGPGTEVFMYLVVPYLEFGDNYYLPSTLTLSQAGGRSNKSKKHQCKQLWGAVNNHSQPTVIKNSIKSPQKSNQIPICNFW